MHTTTQTPGRSSYRARQARPIYVTETIDRAISEYATAFEEGGWEIEKQLDEDLPIVLADAQSLESVLKNLIGNALKYAAQGKWLSVSARAARNRKEVQITV